ncbi:hypothetical protein JF544_13930 [Halobacillus kuroshimensis]|uniref:Uncharacterized protein n=1 Tax=Halobacillus kuroshimensis TaxID=302481 RepID=A0ABS3DYC5_9BACI|nr:MULTISPECIES: hypothetical protein [Halobacillus]MBN8236362.1 hypothetical protein [Halobacillus kuroshimensis]
MVFIKYGLFLLIGAFAHYTLVMMYTQWIMLQRLDIAGSAGPLEAEVFPGFSLIFKVEIGIAMVLIALGIYQIIKENR